MIKQSCGHKKILILTFWFENEIADESIFLNLKCYIILHICVGYLGIGFFYAKTKKAFSANIRTYYIGENIMSKTIYKKKRKESVKTEIKNDCEGILVS